MSNKAEDKEMKPAAQRGLVPKLRFSAFRDAGEWGREFGDVLFDQISDKDHNSDLPVLAITQEQGAIPRNLIDYHVSVTEKSIESYKVVEIGDFIISLRSFQGGIEYSSYKGICSPAYVILRLKSGYSADYFKHFLKTSRFIVLLTRNLEGLRDGKMVSYKQFSELQLPTPSLKEQQKIADCLSSLDELITLEAQKLATFKTHKKGLMQQLFPAEGETLPKLRFPEFWDAGAWEKKPLNDIAVFHKGKGISKSEIDLQGETPCIRYGELYTIYGEVISEVASKTKLQSSELFLSQSNDVLIPSSGETKLDIAKASCLLLDDVALGGDLNVLRSNANGVFLSYLLNGPCKSEIAKKAQGDTVVHLYASQLKLLDVMIPTKTEQQKIAACLTSLDNLISAQTQKLDTLKTHKKGLMQQLFPALNEVQE